MAVRFIPNPAGLAQIQAQLKEVKAVTAEAFAEQLRDNLSAGPRSGVQYADLPRRSSAVNEYSQEQHGTLKGMVKAGEDWFGLAPEGADERKQAEDQEFGDGDRLVGRANVRNTAGDARAKA